MPITHVRVDAVSRRGKLLVERGAHRVRAGDVLRAVDHDQRFVPDHFEPAGRRDRRERLGDDVVVERAPEERFGRGQGDRRIVGLMRAVQREEHVALRPVLR